MVLSCHRIGLFNALRLFVKWQILHLNGGICAPSENGLGLSPAMRSLPEQRRPGQ
jgi:hypothetical protein